MRPPGVLNPCGSVRSGNAATRGTCQPGSGGRVLRTRDVLRVAQLRAPGTEVRGVNSESLLRPLYGRSAVRPLTVGGVTALLGTLLSCGYGSGYSIQTVRDRKSTRLNSSHLVISYAVFCLKKKKGIVSQTHT